LVFKIVANNDNKTAIKTSYTGRAFGTPKFQTQTKINQNKNIK